MFGLMKACDCSASAAQRETRRLHYCGTCKTMGRLYGHVSRLLLNYDAVFLGELLTALSPQTPSVFAPAYVAHNCLTLPNTTQIPLALQYAATANVLPAEFKLTDHISDSGSKIARATRLLLSGAFRKAQKQLLQTWRFPLAELRAQLHLQTVREREAAPTLDRLAEPTANATRLVFQQGALLIGTCDKTSANMAMLGDLFGRLAYLVDAMQDREKDLQTRDFQEYRTLP